MTMPTESQEQKMVVAWCYANSIPIASVPNGFHQNGKKDRFFYGMITSLKKEGYSKGFPDLIVMIPHGQIMFIEMKRLLGSTTSPEQKGWNKTITDGGHCALICKGADAAIRAIKENYKRL